MVQPRASCVVPDSRAACVARGCIFCGVDCAGGDGACACRILFESNRAAPTGTGAFYCGVGGAVSLGALTILVASHPFAPKLVRGDLEVSVLDVGQGDSIFTAFPDGRTMLVDGGGLGGSEWVGGYRSGTDVGEEVVSPYLWSRGLKRLDVVALTHAHHDHIDGLHAVLENFSVGELWVGRDIESAAYRTLLAEASAHGVRIVHKEQGSDFNWDGVTGDVLWPPHEAAATEASNDDSLVMRLTDGSLHFMLPGDAEQSVENELASEQAPLAAEFLKVPHHGSKTSSTEKFLEAVAPKVAVASVGESNPYGHPAESRRRALLAGRHSLSANRSRRSRHRAFGREKPFGADVRRGTSTISKINRCRVARPGGGRRTIESSAGIGRCGVALGRLSDDFLRFSQLRFAHKNLGVRGSLREPRSAGMDRRKLTRANVSRRFREVRESPSLRTRFRQCGQSRAFRQDDTSYSLLDFARLVSLVTEFERHRAIEPAKNIILSSQVLLRGISRKSIIIEAASTGHHGNSATAAARGADPGTD